MKINTIAPVAKKNYSKSKNKKIYIKLDLNNTLKGWIIHDNMNLKNKHKTMFTKNYEMKNILLNQLIERSKTWN